MDVRKFVASWLLAGAAVAGAGAPAVAAAEAPVRTMGYWYVAAVYPNTPQGWQDCGNATVNVYKGHCKLDSETGQWVNLWGYRD